MILSFILDGTILKYAPYSLFSLLIFIFVSKKNNFKYYLYSFILGFLYDFFYSNLLFYNSFIFISCAFIIKKFQIKTNYNLINTLIIAAITIIYYYTVTFIILLIMKYAPFDLIRYYNVVVNSLIINGFFVLFMYLIKRQKHIF